MLELGVGRPDSALADSREAERLDPRNAAVLWRTAHIELWRRNADGADSAAAFGLTVSPANQQLFLWWVEAALVRIDTAWALPADLQDTLLALPATAISPPRRAPPSFVPTSSDCADDAHRLHSSRRRDCRRLPAHSSASSCWRWPTIR